MECLVYALPQNGMNGMTYDADEPMVWNSPYRTALREYPDRSVYDRVFAMPEQTLSPRLSRSKA